MAAEERKVETYLDKLVKERGGITRKWASSNVSGVPDRIVFMPNSSIRGCARQIFVEVKTAFGKLSDNQVREIARLRNVGANVVVVYGLSGVDALIQHMGIGDPVYLPLQEEYR